MGAPRRAAAVEVGERAGELEHPMIAARREAQPLGGVAQQRQAGSVRLRDLLDDARRRARRCRRRRRARARRSARAGSCAPPPTRAATSAEPSRGGGRHQIGGRDRRHVDDEIEAIEQRPGQAAEILRDAALVRRALAGVARLVGRCRSGTGSSPRPAGSAPDRRRDDWRARSPLRRSRSAGAGCRAPGAGTPAVRRGTGRRCGRAKSRRAWRGRRRRPAPASRRNDGARGTGAGRSARRRRASPATEWIIDTSSSSRGVSGGRIDGRRWASIDLPAPGAPLIRRLWPPAAATSSARLALSWPLMSRRSGCGPADARSAGSGRDSTCAPLKWLASWISERGRENVEIGRRPGRLGAARRRADQALAGGVGGDRRRQHAGDGADRPVERQLADHRVSRRARRREWRRSPPSRRARSAGRSGCPPSACRPARD